jgi:hypothetical protein
MGKKVSKAGKGSYAQYRGSNRYSKNKKLKLERHLKKYPDDECAKKCYEDGLKGGFPFTRNAPKTSQWSHTDKHHVEIWTSLGHSGTKYLDFIKKMKKGVTKTTAAITKESNV